jgi:hypothetical protein
LPDVPATPALPLPVPSASFDTPIQQVAWEHPATAPPQVTQPQDFESLERHLKALGAKYYRLEKWGNRGELFRFACLVAPAESYSYEKHFQAIGTDPVTVMQSVIADIETWKNVSPY